MTELPPIPSKDHVDKSGHLMLALRNDPNELWRLLKIALNTFRYRYLIRCVGSGSIVGVGTEIINSSNVKIGRGCLLQDHVYIRAGAQGQVVIGDRVAINSFCRIFGHGGVEIGYDSQIGPGSLITTTDHDVYESLQARFKGVKIGQRVWIGASVTVLPGVEIGDSSVIGAGAVVTKDIPAYTVAVGVPARVVKDLYK